MDARQLSRLHIPGHTHREHGAWVQRLDLRPQQGGDLACCGRAWRHRGQQ
jgi:hypothetical protein